MDISVCSIMYNESLFLEPWIKQLQEIPQIKEIILVDAGSTDGSFELAQELGATVYYNKWENSFAKQRNFALSKTSTKTDWIFFPDLDEHFILDPKILFKRDHDKDFLSHYNQLIIPYLKFYDMKTLWFFNNGQVPRLENIANTKESSLRVRGAANKSTTTIFRKNHLKGFDKDLHEMPTYNDEPKQFIFSFWYGDAWSVDKLNMSFGLMGHYDQVKHFLEAQVAKTTAEYQMGLKRARYRLINPVTYNGKVFNKNWAENVLATNNIKELEELGRHQLESFEQEHNIWYSYDASKLHNKYMKKLWEKLK